MVNAQIKLSSNFSLPTSPSSTQNSSIGVSSKELGIKRKHSQLDPMCFKKVPCPLARLASLTSLTASISSIYSPTPH